MFLNNKGISIKTIIICSVSILLIIFIIIFIISPPNIQPKADYLKMEQQLKQAAIKYQQLYNINLKLDMIYEVNLKTLKERNLIGDIIDPSTYNNCDGYVEYYLESSKIKYWSHIKCDGYVSSGYLG